ncbi:MAG TPA: CbtB-domain containing protein [Gammaproteobacteria bacterium]|nr:CbtB-domain containing protein [Gammaproteobacteria bacterium]
MNSFAVINTSRAVRESRLPAAAGAVLLGLVILYGVGFALGQGDVLHNAAHDTRHTMVFPCH